MNQYTYYNINELETIGFSSNIAVINASFARIGIHDFDYHAQYDYSYNYGASVLYSVNDYISMNAFYRFTGSEQKYFLDDNNNIDIFNTDSYNLLDCSFNTKFFNNKMTFNIGVKNIFDVKQITTINNSPGIHTNNNNISNISYGRSYFSGLKINL